MSKEKPPIYRCTWCGRDNGENGEKCQNCGNTHSLTDRTKPHRPEWSRRTISTVECKVCDRWGPPAIQQSDAPCNPETDKNPTVAG